MSKATAIRRLHSERREELGVDRLDREFEERVAARLDFVLACHGASDAAIAAGATFTPSWVSTSPAERTDLAGRSAQSLRGGLDGTGQGDRSPISARGASRAFQQLRGEPDPEVGSPWRHSDA